MPRKELVLEDSKIDPHKLYDLNAAASKVGLSVWHLREKAVAQRKVACLRHSPKGKILFRGIDLLEYIEACRQPAIGERARAAAKNGVN